MSDRSSEFIERKRQALARKLESKRIGAPPQLASDSKSAAHQHLLSRIDELESLAGQLTARVEELVHENDALREELAKWAPPDA